MSAAWAGPDAKVGCTCGHRKEQHWHITVWDALPVDPASVSSCGVYMCGCARYSTTQNNVRDWWEIMRDAAQCV